MAWILLCFDVLPGASHAMLHQNSVLHGMLKHLPWHRFNRLVEEQRADKHVRRESTKGQLISLLYAQLSGAQSHRATDQANKLSPSHSITSSARARREVGMVRSRSLAVLRFMASSYFVGPKTGMSAGFSPLKMPST